MGSLTQFTCHIGHLYTVEVMLAAQFLEMERSVEQAMRCSVSVLNFVGS